VKALEKRELRLLRIEGEISSLEGHLQAAQAARAAGRRPAFPEESARTQIAALEAQAEVERAAIERARARSRK
jgi:hypothetical protein